MASRKAFATLVLTASLSACGPVDQVNQSEAQSLSLEGAAGKKAYLGWGEVLDGFMGNETKYDVKHTHDIFTSGVGGKYEAKTFTEQQFDGSQVMASMRQITGALGKDDMYVQYSSGHGYQGGLGIGIDYRDMVTTALGSQAKEVVIFTMACHSGSLVDEVNQQKSKWESWSQQGRSLFVMASSTAQELSSTGPGVDAQENGPEGSAGSAYGHALWKALSGDADGFLDGVKDGFVSLGEIAAFATQKTQQVGGHTPVVTGTYNTNLIMNKNPNGAYTAAQIREGGTGAMSVQAVQAATEASDQSILDALVGG